MFKHVRMETAPAILHITERIAGWSLAARPNKTIRLILQDPQEYARFFLIEQDRCSLALVQAINRVWSDEEYEPDGVCNFAWNSFDLSLEGKHHRLQIRGLTSDDPVWFELNAACQPKHSACGCGVS